MEIVFLYWLHQELFTIQCAATGSRVQEPWYLPNPKCSTTGPQPTFLFLLGHFFFIFTQPNFLFSLSPTFNFHSAQFFHFHSAQLFIFTQPNEHHRMTMLTPNHYYSSKATNAPMHNVTFTQQTNKQTQQTKKHNKQTNTTNTRNKQ